MTEQRDSYVVTLADMTLLREETPQPVAYQNREALLKLLSLCTRFGEYFQTAWKPVLGVFSAMNRLQGVLTSADPQAPPTSSEDVDLNNARVIAAIEDTTVDAVYAGTGDLSNRAIVEFATALCAVAKDEVAAKRTYSLQKLVEIAAFNLNPSCRPLPVWADIWVPMGQLLAAVGVMKSIDVFAIDNLRQLSIKFLGKEELAEGDFQEKFLAPFTTILTNNPSRESKEFVLQCVAQLVQKCDFKSGWAEIFRIFRAASLPSAGVQVLRQGFASVTSILSKSLRPMMDYFVECVNCLVGYGQNTVDSAISRKAVEYLNECANAYVGNQIRPDITADEERKALWYPLLHGLARLVTHQSMEIRTSALQSLFGYIDSNGTLFLRR